MKEWLMGTDLVARTLDLTRAPGEQWNEEMVRLVASQVLKRASTRSEQMYCLAVADALGLNPFLDEIYFLPTKSQDGSGPGIKPYIGRNGLVVKAAQHDAYYRAHTVCENDTFRVAHRKDGRTDVTHTWGLPRGEILGAYAFLHFRNGDLPSFFWAPLEEYLPQFDQDWKMAKSAWGNQRSAMIEKCAMIGAGRKRLNLGNVLADGEIARFEQQQGIGPVSVAPPAHEFDFAELTSDQELAERLRVVTAAAGWPTAKCELVFRNMGDDDLREAADRLERDVAGPGPGPEPEPMRATSHAQDEFERVSEAVAAQEAVADAVVVPDDEHRRALERRLETLGNDLNEPDLEERERAELVEEWEQVDRELRALRDPNQGGLFGGEV